MTDRLCSWLPDLIYFEDYEGWILYENALYGKFRTDLVKSKPRFAGRPVNIRKHPIEEGKEDAFYHLTCKDYAGDGERDPDFRRCERIAWIKPCIEQADASHESLKVWEKPTGHKGKYSRMHILHEEERYLVVIEPREKFCLLVTAFYIEQEHTLRKKLREYEKYSITKNLVSDK